MYINEEAVEFKNSPIKFILFTGIYLDTNKGRENIDSKYKTKGSGNFPRLTHLIFFKISFYGDGTRKNH